MTLAQIVAGKQRRLKALLDEAWLLQAEQQTAHKSARLRKLLDEAWPLEAELNDLFCQAVSSPTDRVVQGHLFNQGGRAARAVAREDITNQRIKLALLRGPLALRGQRFSAHLLVERCEDIPGANVVAVRRVLRHLVKRGFVKRDGNTFWRAA